MKPFTGKRKVGFFYGTSSTSSKKDIFPLLEDYFNTYIEKFMTIFLSSFRRQKANERNLHLNACISLYFAADLAEDDFEITLNDLYPSSNIDEITKLRTTLLSLNIMCNGDFTKSPNINNLFDTLYKEPNMKQKECGEYIAQLIKDYLTNLHIQKLDQKIAKFAHATAQEARTDEPEIESTIMPTI